MKFMLILTICSQVHQNCIPPTVHDVVFDSHYKCATEGYQTAKDMLTELGQEFVDKNQVVIGFKCNSSSEV